MTNIYCYTNQQYYGLAFRPSFLSVFLFCYDFRSISHRIGRVVSSICRCRLVQTKVNISTFSTLSVWLLLMLMFLRIFGRIFLVSRKLSTKSNFKWWMKDVMPLPTKHTRSKVIYNRWYQMCVVFSRPPNNIRASYLTFKCIAYILDISSRILSRTHVSSSY